MGIPGNSSGITLSVVIPAYNYAAVLPRAVESVLAQTESADSVELLVVDDGSTDDTAAVLEQLQTRYPGRFRALRKTTGARPPLEIWEFGKPQDIICCSWMPTTSWHPVRCRL